MSNEVLEVLIWMFLGLSVFITWLAWKKQRSIMDNTKMIIRDDTILIDFRLVFKAIREEKGNWEKVEKELRAYLDSVKD